MEKIIKWISYSTLPILAGLFIPNFLFAQGSQFSFSYNIPARMYYHYEDTRPPYLTNTTSYPYSSVSDTGTFSISKLIMQHGKTISFTIPIEQQPYLTIAYTVSFKIDSLLPNLQKFSMSFQNTYIALHANVATTSGIIFDNVPYNEFTDSTLIVNVAGKLCRTSFHSVNYNFSDNEAIMQYYTYKVNNFDSLLEDTSSFRFSLNIFPTPVISKVQNFSVTEKHFIIYFALPDHSIHYSFPSSDHSQTLTIYDILGREVKRIEIPSGVSEYHLQRDGFMSGYYFARLGSQSASFIVN
jgi:hypothetical protein